MIYFTPLTNDPHNSFLLVAHAKSEPCQMIESEICNHSLKQEVRYIFKLHRKWGETFPHALYAFVCQSS